VSVLLLSLAVGACTDARHVAAKSSTTTNAGEPARFVAHPPAETSIPTGPLGVSIRRGLALLTATRDSLPDHVGNDLRCVSCHLDNGRRANSMPWVGVYGRFPQYRSRSGRVITLEDRINGCFERSMAGKPVDVASADMRDMVAYMAFLSQGVPVGMEVEGQGTAKMRPLAGDTVRGEVIFQRSCAQCHGEGGLGNIAPALWGDRSYNIGAGMARVRTAAAFIRQNMPYDKPGILSDQDAFDVAAYMNARPRPDFAGMENDWPNGDAPPDVAYQTKASRVKVTSTALVLPSH
jgi:thiosulfate dehydrogenase